MLKVSLAALLLSLAGAASAAEQSYEVCTLEGPCALRVSDETGADVWLVKEASTGLSQLWDGTWYVTTDEDYEIVRGMVPDSQRWTIPAIEPTSGLTLREAVAATKTPTPQPSGPLIGGTITVTTTIGGGSCADCHKGSTADIHKKKLETGGK